MGKVNKKKFEVGENETIDQCLERMKDEGYMPVRRMEKPIFVKERHEYKPVRQQIIFEGILSKDE